MAFSIVLESEEGIIGLAFDAHWIAGEAIDQLSTRMHVGFAM